MSQQQIDAIEEDSGTGKWLTIKFNWVNKTIHSTKFNDRDFDQELRGPGTGKETARNRVRSGIAGPPTGKCVDPRKE